MHLETNWIDKEGLNQQKPILLVAVILEAQLISYYSFVSIVCPNHFWILFRIIVDGRSSFNIALCVIDWFFINFAPFIHEYTFFYKNTRLIFALNLITIPVSANEQYLKFQLK